MAGAVIGALVLLIIVSLGVFIFTRRKKRRQQYIRRHAARNEGRADSHGAPMMEDAQHNHNDPTQHIRPLSTIHERASVSHSPLSTSTRDKPRSSSALLRPQSFGPHWPLSSRNPLSSHPVTPVDLARSLSGHRHDSLSSQHLYAQDHAPILRMQTPPPPGTPPGTRLAPPPPPPKNKSISPRASTGVSLTSPGDPASTQSLRLKFVPVSPIDISFTEMARKRSSRLVAPVNTDTNHNKTGSASTGVSPISPGGPVTQSPRINFIPLSPVDAPFYEAARKRASRGVTPVSTATNQTQTGSTASSTSPLLSAVTSSLHNLNNAHGATKNRRLTDQGIFINTSRQRPPPDDKGNEPVSPVSPLDEELETQRKPRVSLVSAPGDMDQGAFDVLVSPLSHGDRTNDGQISLNTISPLGSRQGSLEHHRG